MKQNNIIYIAIVMVLFSCNAKQEVDKSLPFYNTPDFTPQWIAATEAAYNKVHTISPFALQDQNGRTVTNKDVAGKIYVANFFFTTCGSICPKMTHNLKKVQDVFAQEKEVMLVSHTVLPEVDDVKRLKGYEERMHIDGNRWLLLTGDKEVLYTLARKSYFADEAIGFEKASNDFLHTENAVLIDKKGRIRGVYNATLELEINKLIEHIRLLQQEE
jgi:protein SCO1/2